MRDHTHGVELYLRNNSNESNEDGQVLPYKQNAEYPSDPTVAII